MKYLSIISIVLLFASCDAFDVLRDQQTVLSSVAYRELSTSHTDLVVTDTLDLMQWLEEDLHYLESGELLSLSIESWRINGLEQVDSASVFEIGLLCDGDLISETLTARPAPELVSVLEIMQLVRLEDCIFSRFRQNSSPLFLISLESPTSAWDSVQLTHQLQLRFYTEECVSLPIGSDLPDCTL